MLKFDYRFLMVDCNGKSHSYKDVLSLATNFNNKYSNKPILVAYMNNKVDYCFTYKPNKEGFLIMYVNVEKLFKAMYCIDNEIK